MRRCEGMKRQSLRKEDKEGRKERKAEGMNIKTECETKRERSGSEVDQHCSDLISVEDVMTVSLLFICQVRRKRSWKKKKKIAF